jgi:hypothetical protein
LLGLAAALLLAVPGAAGAAEAGTVYTLLTDNTLMRVSGSGRVLSRTTLGRAPEDFPSFGDLLARSPNGRTVYALVRGRDAQVAAVVARTGGVRARMKLPAGIVFRRLTVGERTGRIYLAGNSGKGNALSAHLLVLSPAGRRISLTRVREAEGRDWYVNSIAVAPDESRLLITYHGGSTTGADVVELNPVRRCVDRTSKHAACLGRNHGDVAWLSDGVLAAGGGPTLYVLDPETGAVVRSLENGLVNVHVMDFVLRGGSAYVFGGCQYTGGLTEVSLSGGTVRVVVAGKQACGEGATFLGDRLVLGRRPFNTDPHNPQRPSLIFVDVAAGKIVRSVRLPDDPADVLAVG